MKGKLIQFLDFDFKFSNHDDVNFRHSPFDPTDRGDAFDNKFILGKITDFTILDKYSSLVLLLHERISIVKKGSKTEMIGRFNFLTYYNDQLDYKSCMKIL